MFVWTLISSNPSPQQLQDTSPSGEAAMKGCAMLISNPAALTQKFWWLTSILSDTHIEQSIPRANDGTLDDLVFVYCIISFTSDKGYTFPVHLVTRPNSEAVILPTL